MTSWEYRSIRVTGGGSLGREPLDVGELNELGADEWEAFAAVPAALDGGDFAVTDGVHVLLRRPG